MTSMQRLAAAALTALAVSGLVADGFDDPAAWVYAVVGVASGIAWNPWSGRR